MNLAQKNRLIRGISFAPWITPERYPLAGRVLIFALRAQVRQSEIFYYKKIYTFPINSKNIDSENFFLQNLSPKCLFYHFSPYLCIGVKAIRLKFTFL